MADLDKKRRSFDQQNEANPILNKIDAHYLLLATFLIKELQKDRLDQYDISSQAHLYLAGMLDDLASDIRTGIEATVVSGMAEPFYAVVENWSMEDARDYLAGTRPSNLIGDMPRPNYVQETKPVLEELARQRLDGVITPAQTKEAIIQHGLHREQTRALFEDTYRDILMATHNTDERLKRLVREVSSEILQRDGLLAQNNKALAKALEQRLSQDALYRRLTQDGLVGIVDRGGKRWRLDAYSRMVVNTKLTEAHLQATRNLGKQLGLDLALVSTHDAIDACAFWEGVVVSVHGETEGYPNLDDAIATNELFHPNCRHHISMITSFEALTKADQRTHLRKVGAVANPELRPYRRQR